MSKVSFLKLVDAIKPFAKRRSTRVRKDVISLDKRLTLTLYYLKDQGSMQMTANAFGVARCTVGVVVKEICGILSFNLGKELIKFPVEKDDVTKTTQQFQQRFGFPQVIGCVHVLDPGKGFNFFSQENKYEKTFITFILSVCFISNITRETDKFSFVSAYFALHVFFDSFHAALKFHFGLQDRNEISYFHFGQ